MGFKELLMAESLLPILNCAAVKCQGNCICARDRKTANRGRTELPSTWKTKLCGYAFDSFDSFDP